MLIGWKLLGVVSFRVLLNIFRIVLFLYRYVNYNVYSSKNSSVAVHILVFVYATEVIIMNIRCVIM